MNSSSATVSIEGMWTGLATGLNDVFGRVLMSPSQYMSYYSQVFKFCMQQNTMNSGDSAEFMGSAVYDKLKDYVDFKAARIIEVGKPKNGEDLLNWYNMEWTDYHFSSRVIDGIFSYLNRHFLRKMIDDHQEVEYFLVSTLVVQIWKENLFGILGHRVTDAALELIRKERHGETVSRSLLKAVLSSYVDIGVTDEATPNFNSTAMKATQKQAEEKRLSVYKEHFEKMFIETTKEFYEAEANEFLAAKSVVEYMKKVEKRLLEEEDRASFYLHSSSKDTLIKTVEDVMITRRIQLFQGQFGPLLEQMAKEDLARMYSLCSRVDLGLEYLREALKDHIVKEGVSIMARFEGTAEKEPKAHIEALLEVHRRYSVLIEEAFNNEHGFLQSLDKAATVFINRNAVTVKDKKHNAQKTPELLAKCCDGLLKKSSKMMDEIEMDAALEKMVLIFKYIEDKDIFSKIHTRFFSRRLITATSASEEAEVSLITKLKTMCGFEYTNRMTKMIADVRTSGDLSADFNKEYSNQMTTEGLPDFSVLVLSTGSWPSMPLVSLNLPLKMARSVDLLSKFYMEKHTGRKITWVFGQSRGEIAASCFSGKKIFMATCPQMAVLMLYNTATSYTFMELVEATGMDKKNTSVTIATLIKNELLKGDDLTTMTTTEYTDDSKFELNLGYRNKKVKVDLTKIQIRSAETKKDDDKELSRSVEEDRRNVIQACIVRILKMRKTVSHQQLMLEVLEQLATRFKPRVDSVKKCIGILMEKDYMRRSEEARDIYEYMA